MRNRYLKNREEIFEVLENEKIQRVMIVCSERTKKSSLVEFLLHSNFSFTFFTNFHSNPLYEEVVAGVQLFHQENCEFILSIGGGSAIDVAKCIKAYANMEDNTNYLKQKIVQNFILHLAIPTTAGTGSEETHFAVIYYQNEKQSVADLSLQPDYVLLQPELLETLPLSQKKATMLDALCQGIESYWCIYSTEESKNYAKEAISLILEHYKAYLENDSKSYSAIMKASNYSGRAINISKTTAPHAMSYKITSLYGVSHGSAVAMCLPYVWKYMIHHMESVTDERGKEYLENVFTELDEIFGVSSHEESIQKFFQILDEIHLERKEIIQEEDMDKLVSSVNESRLKNNPIALNEEAIRKIYREVKS